MLINKHQLSSIAQFMQERLPVQGSSSINRPTITFRELEQGRVDAYP
jgi:hypothetical protein